VKLITRIFLLLIVSSLLFALGCGGRSTFANAGSSLDKLIEFDETGRAVVRGRISGDYSCTVENGQLRGNIQIEVPANIQGIDGWVALTFKLRFETELSSKLVPYTNLRDYLSANPDSTTFDAFAIYETIDVTFIKKDGVFEALAIRRITDTEQSVASVNGLFSTDILSKGTLEGTINGANWGEEGVTWILSIPRNVQGVEAAIHLPIQSSDHTEVITKDGALPIDMYHPGGHVQVNFVEEDHTLKAVRFTELP
jgi:hypothetical protein